MKPITVLDGVYVCAPHSVETLVFADEASNSMRVCVCAHSYLCVFVVHGAA